MENHKDHQKDLKQEAPNSPTNSQKTGNLLFLNLKPKLSTLLNKILRKVDNFLEPEAVQFTHLLLFYCQ